MRALIPRLKPGENEKLDFARGSSLLEVDTSRATFLSVDRVIERVGTGRRGAFNVGTPSGNQTVSRRTGSDRQKPALLTIWFCLQKSYVVLNHHRPKTKRPKTKDLRPKT
jgi:hypothetical protein